MNEERIELLLRQTKYIYLRLAVLYIANLNSHYSSMIYEVMLC